MREQIKPDKDWFTFYCGNCNCNVCGDARKCRFCGAILQDKKAYTKED
jgi:hypothetical protein